MLKVKLIQPTKYWPIASSRRQYFEALTNSPDKFDKWCRKNYIFVRFGINNRRREGHGEGLIYPGTNLVYVKVMYSSKFEYELIAKKWGFFNENYDPLSTIDKLKFKVDKRFGKITPLLEMVL